MSCLPLQTCQRNSPTFSPSLLTLSNLSCAPVLCVARVPVASLCTSCSSGGEQIQAHASTLFGKDVLLDGSRAQAERGGLSDAEEGVLGGDVVRGERPFLDDASMSAPWVRRAGS